MRVRGRIRRRSGAAMVELAIMLPVFIFLVFGLIEASRLGMVAQILATAAREGCRVAVIDGNVNSDVTNQINTFLSSASIDSSNVTVVQTPTDCTTVSSGDDPNTVSVTLSVPYSKVSWLGTPLYFQSAVVTGTATMSSERP
jgi:Flp pilus assembly protein TadG